MAEEPVSSLSLFSDDLLYNLEFSDDVCTCKLPDGMSPKTPGEGLCMRALQFTDFSKGYSQLLAQLTRVGDLTQDKFEEQFRGIQASPNTHYITVIEDTTRGELVASASLIVERKFTHLAAMRGRIEDVIVADSCRGRQLGKLLLETLSLLAIKLECYKISLECVENNVPFYAKFGFKQEDSLFMVRRIFD
ncbi:glucosamine 6-phosphate N-acetyltransferase-like [Sycon ciliatum]|uniref:glucosamine 6-phosphate N-acetyltransferase-like n=1 Tax=Sycon ciliatum TaxID=27933 RepID=UPI0020A8CB05|eukprot:scpid81363/ scgid18753/ Glucosamine 6-phosphate N-acetyltransferase; Phosphoglucosamine acetylase; Phosphoglucosamine transacetylase &gt; Glucosamine 6-phosphate N-acetyltransferase; Phosphoglucosamine acetylase; Phosphoglucosamine transacetylase